MVFGATGGCPFRNPADCPFRNAEGHCYHHATSDLSMESPLFKGTRDFPPQPLFYSSYGDPTENSLAATMLDISSPAAGGHRVADSSEVAWLKHELQVQGQHLERKQEEVQRLEEELVHCERKRQEKEDQLAPVKEQNYALQDEVQQLRIALSAAQKSDVPVEDSAFSQLMAEVAELKARVAELQAKAAQVEELQAQLVELEEALQRAREDVQEARTAVTTEVTQSLQAEIAELEEAVAHARQIQQLNDALQDEVNRLKLAMPEAVQDPEGVNSKREVAELRELLVVLLEELRIAREQAVQGPSVEGSANLSAELAQLERRVAQLQPLENENAALERQVTQLKEALQRAQEEAAQAAQQGLEAAAEKASELEAKQQKLQEEAESHSDEALLAEVAELKDALQWSQDTAARAVEKVDMLEANAGALRDEAARLQEALQRAEEALQRAEEDATLATAIAQDGRASGAERAAEVAGEVARLKEELQKAHKEATQARTAAAAAEERQASTAAQVEALQAKVTNLQEEVTQLKEKLQKAHEEAVQAQASAAVAEGGLASGAAQVEAMEAEMQKLREELARRTEELQKAREEARQAQAAVAVAQDGQASDASKAAALEAERQKLQEEVAQLNEALQKAQEEAAQAATASTAAQQGREAAVERASELESKQQKLKEELRRLEDELEATKQEQTRAAADFNSKADEEAWRRTQNMLVATKEALQPLQALDSKWGPKVTEWETPPESREAWAKDMAILKYNIKNALKQLPINQAEAKAPAIPPPPKDATSGPDSAAAGRVPTPESKPADLCWRCTRCDSLQTLPATASSTTGLKGSLSLSGGESSSTAGVTPEGMRMRCELLYSHKPLLPPVDGQGPLEHLLSREPISQRARELAQQERGISDGRSSWLKGDTPPRFLSPLDPRASLVRGPHAIVFPLGELVRAAQTFARLASGVGRMQVEKVPDCLRRPDRFASGYIPRHTICLVDATSSQLVDFWEFLAIQLYLRLDLQIQGLPVAEWIEFCAQHGFVAQPVDFRKSFLRPMRMVVTPPSQPQPPEAPTVESITEAVNYIAGL